MILEVMEIAQRIAPDNGHISEDESEEGEAEENVAEDAAHDRLIKVF
jgi:hypothetical protein